MRKASGLMSLLLSAGMLAGGSCGSSPGTSERTKIEKIVFNADSSTEYVARAHGDDGTTFHYWAAKSNLDGDQLFGIMRERGESWQMVAFSGGNLSYAHNDEGHSALVDFNDDSPSQVLVYNPGLTSKNLKEIFSVPVAEKPVSNYAIPDFCATTQLIADKFCPDVEKGGSVIEYMFDLINEGSPQTVAKKLTCDGLLYQEIDGCSDLAGGGFTSAGIIVEEEVLGTGPSISLPTADGDGYKIYPYPPVNLGACNYMTDSDYGEAVQLFGEIAQTGITREQWIAGNGHPCDAFPDLNAGVPKDDCYGCVEQVFDAAGFD